MVLVWAHMGVMVGQVSTYFWPNSVNNYIDYNLLVWNEVSQYAQAMLVFKC